MATLIAELKTLTQKEKVFNGINTLHRKMKTGQINFTDQNEFYGYQWQLKEILESISFELPEAIRKKGEDLLDFLEITSVESCLGYFEEITDGIFITYPSGKVEVFKVENHPQILNSIGFCDDDDTTIEVIFGAYKGCCLKIYYADSPFPEEYENYPVYLLNQ